MPGRFDIISLFFFGVASACSLLLLIPLFFPVTFVAVLWFFVTTMSIAMLGHMGNRIVRLYVGEKTVQAHYPYDQLEPIIKASEQKDVVVKSSTTTV